MNTLQHMIFKSMVGTTTAPQSGRLLKKGGSHGIKEGVTQKETRYIVELITNRITILVGRGRGRECSPLAGKGNTLHSTGVAKHLGSN